MAICCQFYVISVTRRILSVPSPAGPPPSRPARPRGKIPRRDRPPGFSPPGGRIESRIAQKSRAGSLRRCRDSAADYSRSGAALRLRFRLDGSRAGGGWPASLPGGGAEDAPVPGAGAGGLAGLAGSLVLLEDLGRVLGDLGELGLELTDLEGPPDRRAEPVVGDRGHHQEPCVGGANALVQPVSSFHTHSLSLPRYAAINVSSSGNTRLRRAKFSPGGRRIVYSMISTRSGASSNASESTHVTEG